MQHSPRSPHQTGPHSGTPEQDSDCAPEFTTPSASTTSEDVIAVCNQAGEHATACVAAFIAQEHDDIVQESASFMLELESIWQHLALEPSEVWTEILRRIEVGELFVRLNQPPHRKKLNGHTVRPWRISTSKLP